MDWASYWRAPDRPLEAMHAHFERHVYHRHSHETYSFGVTETGTQAFTCRGAARASVAGMVMAFNPDDPHDGRAAQEDGFTYRIVHIGPELVAEVLRDTGDRTVGLPLFAEPVLCDHALADALRRLHGSLSESRLAQDEALHATVRALVRRASTRPIRTHSPSGEVRRARELLEAAYAEDLRAEDLAHVAGCSRFALHRAFVAAYGLAPSDYQRQLRLRAARRLLTEGRTPAEVAASTGFADQSHLTRWFKRYYGVTPGRFLTANMPQ
ncbi:AraC-like DNA-binding protein [Amycolatopsis bartoniae]|uniref:Transcriptional regulator n=1 Tax=Amycolatopsis bartoniae TaxID=941986 RepID=A0A8H9J5Q6_9PSEU|nr:AraC family transcriptional regulator [Amycolatopsis bartoniae]MBB2937369.1 AraC-like DNA-binding protein [Amycolatopsis bartoniae]TVT01614.1 AraC family transcriptional regulator [Amycolatopsis bartoniae]GHF78493.1 transcriptional regulator [Amycolatopsis bartoniae]